MIGTIGTVRFRELVSTAMIGGLPQNELMHTT